MRLTIYLDLSSAQKVQMTPPGNGYEPGIGIGGYTLDRPLLDRGSECFSQHVFRGDNVARPCNEERDKASVAFACYPLDNPVRLTAAHVTASIASCPRSDAPRLFHSVRLVT